MLRATVGEPLIQRLIAVYLLAHDGLSPNTDEARLRIFADALAVADVARASGADRLASLAYSRGRYALAARFAAKGQSSLALWVRAKLATQKGDVAGAVQLIAAAAKNFASDDGSLERESQQRLVAEGGVLSLSLHDYEAALRQLLAASSVETYAGREVGGDYWGDAAHLAERVLTVDELKQFVDREVPADGPPANALLRDLLARRLMRVGRFADALPYFTDPVTHDHAHDYADAMNRASSAWTDVGQARAYFEAAVLAHDFGMEMMGTEGTPDFASNGGNFGFGIGSSHDTVAEADAEERARVDASAEPIARRYHYRFVAVDLAEKAADRLPKRSQAFAAVLCRATRWMQLTADGQDSFRTFSDYAQQWERDAFVDARDDAERLYRRYVKEGPLVPWAENWASMCQDPDFDRARFFGPRIWLESLYRRIARHVIRTGSPS
jgi:hypothetical protein